MAAVSSNLHRKTKKCQDFYFYFFSTRLHNSLKEHNHQVQNKSKEPDRDSFLPKEANEIFFLVLFIHLDPCMKHDKCMTNFFECILNAGMIKLNY